MKKKEHFDLEVVDAAAKQLRKHHGKYAGFIVKNPTYVGNFKDLSGVLLHRDKTTDKIRDAFKKAAMSLREA